MTSLQDEILSAFIDQNTRQLKDTEVSIALTRKGIACSPEEVQRHVRSLSPALFQVTFNTDRTVTIRVEPTIEICEGFRTTRCQAPAKSCNKLHICRHLVSCSNSQCGFPHNFTKGYNHKIVTDHHCQNINPILLVKLLDLQKSPTRPPYKRDAPRGRGHNRRRGRGRGFGNISLPRTISTQEDDSDRQVDVSFPSSSVNKQINMEAIELLLTLRGIKVKDKLDENENEYCRRATILLERINDVQKLLVSPILDHNGTDVKFKRTKQIIDKTNFILKTSIENEQDKIDQYRLELYINTLVDKNLIDTISDLSTDSEQIKLVQCRDEIDFDKVRQGNLSRPQLYGKDITVTQIYECDALEIRSNRQNESITEDKLKRIFHSVWKDIFAYHFPAANHAEVEFINANALKQWRSAIDYIQNKFDVTIIPIVDSIEENSIDTRSNVSSEPEARSHQATLKLRPDWALIAGHRNFKIEYKEFIHQAFGGNVDVKEDEAIYTGTFPRHTDASRSIVIFGNKTNEFMRQFQCETFEKLDENQVQILRTSSDTVAYTRTNANDYMVATKLREMSDLKSKVFKGKNPPKSSDPKPNPPRDNPPLKSPSVSSLTTSTSIYPINTPDRMNMFSIETFEDRLQRYIDETFNVKLICEKSKNNIRLKITGQMNDVENALEDIDNLFSSLRTKKFDNTTDGNWTRIEDAIQVINYHFKGSDMICICKQISATNVNVYFFDITNPQFGIDEQKIEDLIRDRFRSATIPLNQQSISPKLAKDWADLEEKIRQRDDYKKKICFSNESNTIYLFGVPELVKEFRQRFEQLKRKYDPQPCKITLSEEQLKFLTHVAKADMNKLEKEYRSDGCDINLTRLRQNCEFLAPLDMHSDIKDKLQALAQIRDILFDISEPGFEQLISKEPERLLSLVKSKCYLDKKIDTCRVHIPIPKARGAVDLDNGMKSTTGASANPSGVTSVNIGHSTVTITTGDLTAQAVDAIVVCSSSGILCERIVRPAGAQVMKEYAALKSSDNFPNTTSGGALPCKKIIFVPWAPTSRDTAAIKSSLSSFIAVAFMHAISDGCKSIAFPAVGCGQFHHDPLIIAKYMLRETRDQLKAAKSKMNISFVLLANQTNVYDAFVKCLNDMESIDITVSHKVPSKKKDDQLSIPFDRKTVKIILISSNDNHLIKCKEDILNLARSCSITSRTTKQEILDWPQDAIYKYYDYCLKQHVIPTLDLDKTILELTGSKDAVHECEKHFYQLTNEILDEQRIHAVAQGVIWLVESTPNSDKWEEYSRKRIGIIENAYSKKHPQVNFDNDAGEKCQIIFSKMEEQSPSKTRRVRRELADSILPKTWQNSAQNRTRITLQPTSQEYQDVLGQFHETMLGKYTQIIKIERIQNERWYKQYAAHRDDFQKRYSQPNERLLFHGCPSASADLIIDKCFNRSFAGVNGVLYGCGVYFHAQASYSHQYAQANSAGERTMFLVRVLIGKTCKGDKTMKVVPSGFDTTTDGQHIYVVYHDAGAYADHLITYK